MLWQFVWDFFNACSAVQSNKTDLRQRGPPMVPTIGACSAKVSCPSPGAQKPRKKTRPCKHQLSLAALPVAITFHVQRSLQEAWAKAQPLKAMGPWELKRRFEARPLQALRHQKVSPLSCTVAKDTETWPSEPDAKKTWDHRIEKWFEVEYYWSIWRLWGFECTKSSKDSWCW